MYRSPRLRSPKLALRPLSPPPWTPAPHYTYDPDKDTAEISTFTIFPAVFIQPFDDPHEVLCHEFNVAKTDIPLGPTDVIPPTIKMLVLRDAHMPTHVLIILDSSNHNHTHHHPHSPVATSAPLAVPINAELFARKFTNDISRLSMDLSIPGSTLPVPFWDPSADAQVVTLPTLPLRAHHPASIPLLLLYGLGLHHTAEPRPHQYSSSSPPTPTSSSASRRRPSSSHNHARITVTSTGTLAAYLLPMPVIEEFPAAPAMAEVMARQCGDAELRRRVAFNQGLWGNVLALAPRDTVLVEIVRVAWNVTAEARRIRERWRSAAAVSSDRSFDLT